MTDAEMKVTMRLLLASFVILSAFLLVLGLMGVLATKTALASAGTLYVAPGANCGSAIPCYASIQAAVDIASNGDTIKVAQGVYTSAGFQVVYITKAIIVSGGYTTTDWMISSPLTYPTVIDAENVSRRRGIYLDGTNIPTITLAGLTIRRGNVTDSGGGVYLKAGYLVIQSSTILSNTGGGVYIETGALRLTQSLLKANSALSGGGLHVTIGTATLIDNTFEGNSASHGAGVSLAPDVNGLVQNNVFKDNQSSGSGGGVALGWQGGAIALIGNLFQNNSADQGGGAYVRAATVVNNVFQDNTAYQDGGAVYIQEGTGPTTVTSNSIFSNTAINGGGLYLYSGNVSLERNSIISNTANTAGGGMYVRYSIATMNSNTFISNTAQTLGGGLSIGDAGTVNAQNDILANNTSSWEGVSISVGTLTARHWTLVGNGNYALTAVNGGVATLTNTIVATHAVGGFTGFNIVANHTLSFNAGVLCTGGAICANTITGNPMFVNPTSGDYHIGNGSPAIDAGVNAGVTVDIDGDPRPLGGYDIGADEYWPLPRRVYLPLVLH